MFKNLAVFDISDRSNLHFVAFEKALQDAAHVEGGAQQEKSVGWRPPRGGLHDAFLESIGGHWLASFVIETRRVPAEVVRKRVEAMSSAVQAQTGRKPGRKELKQMKVDAIMQLLPQVLPRAVEIPVWIDPVSGILGVGTVNQSNIDDVVTSLIRCEVGLKLSKFEPKVAPADAMREWLLLEADEQLPPGMSLGSACVLRQEDAGKATARFSNQHLACEEVRQGLLSGKKPVSLDLCWDDRVELTLHACGHFKSIRVFGHQHDLAAKNKGGDLDADFALFTAEMTKVIAQLRREIDRVGDRIAAASDASSAAIRSITTMWSDAAHGATLL